MAKPKKLTPWVVCEPEPVVGKLTETQRLQIAGVLSPIILTVTNWAKIERARQEFVWCRWFSEKAIGHQPFVGRLQAIRDATHSLLIGFCGSGPKHENGRTGYSIDAISLLLWREFERVDRDLKLEPELLNRLGRIGAAADQLLQAGNQRQESLSANDWPVFIDILASIFDDHKVRPTAAKSSRAKNPIPSPFVRFVWRVMESLPPEWRMHMHSWEGMAKAISHSLALRTSRQPRGTDEANELS